MKILIALLLLITLTGCAAWPPVKYAANKVCDASSARQAILAEEFDRATFPHSIRVRCAVQQPPIND